MHNLILLCDHFFAVGVEARQTNVGVAHLKGVACCEIPASGFKTPSQYVVRISHIIAASKDGVYEAIFR